VCEHLGSDISLSELASQAGLSPHYFSLLFKRAFGVSPYRYVLSARIHRAKRLLGERKMAISEIALELGFADQSHFSKVFKTFVGSAPGQYRSLS
jgi:AraC family transcriptional regulator